MPADALIPEALGLALGEIIAGQRREWQREHALAIAELRTQIAELVARVATIDRDARDVAELTALQSAKAVLSGFRQPRDGRDGATLEQIEPLVEAIVLDKLEANPAPPGKDGAPGKLPIVEEWQDRVYYAGDVVEFAGSTYQARVDTGREPTDGIDWICLARRGDDGMDGRLPRLRGLWKADEAYQALDIATLNGSAWGAICDDPGLCPGDGWRLLVQQGKAGKPGEPGKPGKPEPSAVVAGTVDGNGLLTLVNADGSTVAIDLYPALAKVRT